MCVGPKPQETTKKQNMKLFSTLRALLFLRLLNDLLPNFFFCFRLINKGKKIAELLKAQLPYECISIVDEHGRMLMKTKQQYSQEI